MYECSGDPAPNSITDFSDVTSDLTWGSGAAIQGSIYSFALPPASISVSSDAAQLDVTGNAGADSTIASVGLAFDACWDASAFSGIEFLLDGDLGGCSLQFFVHTNSTIPVDHEAMIGACSGTCTAAGVALPNQSGTVSVPWSDLSGGVPDFSADEIVGVSWLLSGQADCQFDVTLDDVAFTGQ
jgi:hypothetical protein